MASMLDYGPRILILTFVSLFCFIVVSSNSFLAVAFFNQKSAFEGFASHALCSVETKCKQFYITQEPDLLSSGFLNGTLAERRGIWENEVLKLNHDCPVILSGHHQRSGLGHSFMSFNTLVAISSFYKVTLNATFPERLSHAPNLAEVAKFFHGPVFRARFKDVICRQTINTATNSLIDVITKAKRLCKNGPICINMVEEARPSEVFIDVNGYRKNFHVPDQTARALKELPPFRDEYLRIALHLRRGDVVNRTRYAERWIYNEAYMDFIPKLVRRIQTKLPIVVIVFAEGAKSIEEIPDVLPATFHNFSTLHENVSLGPSEMHLALATLCSSDILVTSSSGYSHLAALLCDKPHILAVPFWHSYLSFPNLLTELTITRGQTGGIVKLGLPSTFRHDC